MTNTIYVRPVYEDESLAGSETSDEPGAVANSIETKVKKGLCYRCLKGNRFTEKEVCIVCNAKYCIKCVLRAMGSMPEGRKCVTCIGFHIDESKRRGLGECSRLLKRLLSASEIRHVMEAEKFCEANQLYAGLVYVNGQQLCQEELVSLQSCPNPPRELKPGRYWYDNISGLWGKEGQKPGKTISSRLNVGGLLMANASDGNTKVFINNREITKVELRVLQLAGIQCARDTHLWVDMDGSYQEEGQQKIKYIKGNLWSKAGIKLVCAVLSLPFPYRDPIPSVDVVRGNSVIGVAPSYQMRTLQKLLLVGYNGSGTSTIFKQVKILYKSEPFSEDERQNIKLTIQSNMYGYLGILLEGRESFEKESLNHRRTKQFLNQPDVTDCLGDGNESDDKSIYSIEPRLKAFSDWLVKFVSSGNFEASSPTTTRKYAPLIEELWEDAAIQATFSRRSELQMLPSVASYFLQQAVHISRTDYEPSYLDILYAEGVISSNDQASIDFSFPQSAQDCSIDASNQHEPSLRYELIRVNSTCLRENCQWLEMFEDVGVVIFCVSLSDYDQFHYDGRNKMVANRRLFQSIVTHPIAEEMHFHLILNKLDLLEEKIGQVPLTQCDWFNDFNPMASNSVSLLAQQASHYIAFKFKSLFTSLTGRKLYVSMVNGLESDSVDEALRYATENQKWDEERAEFCVSECSSYGSEANRPSLDVTV